MSEFRGDVGTIYTNKSDTSDLGRWEAWFEDFNIIGQGNTELEAMHDAARMTLGMHVLVISAITKLERDSTVSTTAGTGD